MSKVQDYCVKKVLQSNMRNLQYITFSRQIIIKLIYAHVPMTFTLGMVNCQHASHPYWLQPA